MIGAVSWLAGAALLALATTLPTPVLRLVVAAIGFGLCSVGWRRARRALGIEKQPHQELTIQRTWFS